MSDLKWLNQRKDDRYFIQEIPVAGIGSVVEVSKNGLKLRKAPGFTPTVTELTLPLGSRKIRCSVRWDNKLFTGLRADGVFNSAAVLDALRRKVKESVPPPQMRITDKAIQQYKRDEVAIAMVELLMEVESPEPNVLKIGRYIEQICTLERKALDLEKQAQETDAGPDESKEEVTKEHRPCFRDALIEKIVLQDGESANDITDVNFAVTRLGINTICTVLRAAVQKRIKQSGATVSLFPNYDAFSILKSTLFRDLCAYFGYSDIQPEGNALLSFEMAGVEILIKESEGILDQFYKTPTRLYAEVARAYEYAFFGVDPLQIDQYYFEKCVGAFEELYNGHILAHCTLNPHYTPADTLKISLSKDGLIHAAIANLTILAVLFILDRDRESGYVLRKRLQNKGMHGSMVEAFLEKAVREANSILKDFEIRKTISLPSLPESTFPIDSFLGKGPLYDHFRKAFVEFDRGNARRMTLRYEDQAYTHTILNRLFTTDGMSLNARMSCVIPCKNLSNTPWYARDFAPFDLLVFKDIHALTDYHRAAFLKLWSTFEGQIIATVASDALMDVKIPTVHEGVRDSIVDFPSYYQNDTVYPKMVGQTISYLAPYYGDQLVDSMAYTQEIFSMTHIKSDILLKKEIS